MNLSQIFHTFKEKSTLEDIFLLGLIFLFIIEKKCDTLFIIILFTIFIAGINEDILSIILKNDLFNMSKIAGFIFK